MTNFEKRAPALSAQGREGASSERLLFIDGLRGIAVLCVIGFHASVPYMNAGFIGVDVFFVISGFVITRQIVRNVERGSFSFLEFYTQRLLRLGPPLVLVCLVTVAAAVFFPLLPSELSKLDRTAAAALAMASNYYLSAQSGYFETSSQINPLLHTWSLGVEEQYYLFAPAGIVAMLAIASRSHRPGSKVILLGALVILLVSLALAIAWPDRRLAFFSIWTRAWQFSAGAAASQLAAEKAYSSVRASWLAVAGLLGILISTVLFEESSTSSTMASVAATVSTFLVLLGGQTPAGSPAIRLLTSQTMLAFGAVSYSWYLWHWPVVTLVRTRQLMQPDLVRDLACALLALLLAVVTYWLLERPIGRFRRGLHSRPVMRRIAVAGVALGGLAFAVALVSATSADKTVAAARPETILACQAWPEGRTIGKFTPCFFGKESGAQTAVWGDSMAWIFYYQSFARDLLKDANRGVWVLAPGACPPLTDVKIDTVANCDKARSEIAALVNPPASRFDSLVLAGRWRYYDGEPTPSKVLYTPRLIGTDGHIRFQEILAAALRHEIQAALAGSIKRVLLIGPLPEMTQWPPSCLWRASRSGRPLDGCALSRLAFMARSSETIDTLRHVAAQFENVRLIDPSLMLCDQLMCRPYDADGASLYVDDAHLNERGAAKLAQIFAADFDWLLGRGINQQRASR